VEIEADARLIEYVGRLSHRWSEAVIVPRVNVKHGDWQPFPKKCHANVTKWTELNPHHRAIRGWMLMDLRIAGPLFGQAPRVELLAHSVIEDEKRNLFDITPAETPYGKPNEYPFLKHSGDDDEYGLLIDGYTISRIRIYGFTPERITYLPI